jgi:predicted phage gp36 major capsid-like protein
MDIQSILNELREQRDRIQQAIDALERTAHPTATGKRRGPKPGRHMSADARARIGAAMRKAWAKRKKSGKAS